MNILRAVRVTRWSTRRRFHLIIKSARAGCSTQPCPVFVWGEHAGRRWYATFEQLQVSWKSSDHEKKTFFSRCNLFIIQLYVFEKTRAIILKQCYSRVLPRSRLMDGNSGAESAPSLSSWSIRPEATVLKPVLSPGCCGNVLPLRGKEFDLNPLNESVSRVTNVEWINIIQR